MSVLDNLRPRRSRRNGQENSPPPDPSHQGETDHQNEQPCADVNMTSEVSDIPAPASTEENWTLLGASYREHEDQDSDTSSGPVESNSDCSADIWNDDGTVTHRFHRPVFAVSDDEDESLDLSGIDFDDALSMVLDDDISAMFIDQMDLNNDEDDVAMDGLDDDVNQTQDRDEDQDLIDMNDGAYDGDDDVHDDSNMSNASTISFLDLDDPGDPADAMETETETEQNPAQDTPTPPMPGAAQAPGSGSRGGMRRNVAWLLASPESMKDIEYDIWSLHLSGEQSPDENKGRRRTRPSPTRDRPRTPAPSTNMYLSDDGEMVRQSSPEVEVEDEKEVETIRQNTPVDGPLPPPPNLIGMQGPRANQSTIPRWTSHQGKAKFRHVAGLGRGKQGLFKTSDLHKPTPALRCALTEDSPPTRFPSRPSSESATPSTSLSASTSSLTPPTSIEGSEHDTIKPESRSGTSIHRQGTLLETPFCPDEVFPTWSRDMESRREALRRPRPLSHLRHEVQRSDSTVGSDDGNSSQVSNHSVNEAEAEVFALDTDGASVISTGNILYPHLANEISDEPEEDTESMEVHDDSEIEDDLASIASSSSSSSDSSDSSSDSESSSSSSSSSSSWSSSSSSSHSSSSSSESSMTDSGYFSGDNDGNLDNIGGFGGPRGMRAQNRNAQAPGYLRGGYMPHDGGGNHGGRNAEDAMHQLWLVYNSVEEDDSVIPRRNAAHVHVGEVEILEHTTEAVECMAIAVGVARRRGPGYKDPESQIDSQDTSYLEELFRESREEAEREAARERSSGNPSQIRRRSSIRHTDRSSSAVDLTQPWTGPNSQEVQRRRNPWRRPYPDVVDVEMEARPASVNEDFPALPTVERPSNDMNSTTETFRSIVERHKQEVENAKAAAAARAAAEREKAAKQKIPLSLTLFLSKHVVTINTYRMMVERWLQAFRQSLIIPFFKSIQRCSDLNRKLLNIRLDIIETFYPEPGSGRVRVTTPDIDELLDSMGMNGMVGDRREWAEAEYREEQAFLDATRWLGEQAIITGEGWDEIVKWLYCEALYYEAFMQWRVRRRWQFWSLFSCSN